MPADDRRTQFDRLKQLAKELLFAPEGHPTLPDALNKLTSKFAADRQRAEEIMDGMLRHGFIDVYDPATMRVTCSNEPSFGVQYEKIQFLRPGPNLR